MTFKLSTTELQIIDILAGRGGHMKTIQVVLAFKNRRPNTAKQTIYRSIRSLKRKEALIVAKGYISVNTHWIRVAKQKLDILESYSLHQDLPDKISYTFPSFLSFAPVITHHANVLINQAGTDRPIIFINPHQWFFVAREWSEDQLVNKLEADGYTLWQGITHHSEIDKDVLVNKFSNRPTILGTFITAKKNEEDVYINIIGDYVIRVTTTKEFADKINSIYNSNKKITEDIPSQIEEALKYSGDVKMVIKKDKKKADGYRRLMKKYIG